MKKTVLFTIIILIIGLTATTLSACNKTDKYNVTFDWGFDDKVETLLLEKGSNLPNLTIPTREHFLFKHWEIDGETIDYANYTVENDITLKAIWNNSVDIRIFSTESDSKLFQLPIGTKTLPDYIKNADAKVVGYDDTSYDFVGYYTLDEYNEPIPFDTETAITGDLDLYLDLCSKGLEIRDGIVLSYDGENNKHIRIPNYYNGETVTAIEKDAFHKRDTEVILDGITFPTYLQSIGSNAFQDVLGLGDIYLSRHTSILGRNAFGSTLPTDSITSFTIEQDAPITTIPEILLSYQYNLTELNLSKNITTIETQAFMGIGIYSITLPNSLRTIGEKTFSLCNELRNVEITNTNTTICNHAFEGCDNNLVVYLAGEVQSNYTTSSWNCTKVHSNDACEHQKTLSYIENIRIVDIDYKGYNNPFHNGKNAILGTNYVLGNYATVSLQPFMPLNKPIQYFYIIQDGKEIPVTNNEGIITNISHIKNGDKIIAKYAE